MKTKLLFLLFLTSLTTYAQVNLVSNGGFETWTNNVLSNWTSENNVTQNTLLYTEGSKSAKLTIANSTTRPKILAEVPMIAGITYTVKFKYKYISSNYSGQHPISLKIEKAGSAAYLSNSIFASNNDWTLKETTFTADQNTSYDLSISMTTFDSEGFDVLIDDVQVYIEGTEQYTLIPDGNFENKLIALGIDKDGKNGKVLTKSIASIKTLSISYSSIFDLTGIQDFVSLTELYCNNNQLGTLDVSKNTNLILLQCNNNQFTTLDLSKNLALSNLNCHSNLFTTLDLSKNVNLTKLDCFGNKLKNIDISTNVALTYIEFGRNQLTTLDLSKNVALNSLYCYNNQLTTLEVSKNLALSYLDCSSNQLSSLDVSKNLALNRLFCSSNQLTTLDLSKNAALIRMFCNSNKLVSLNLKNGQNTLITNININLALNINLNCIQVDDVAYSNANWANTKDASASYNTSCPSLGIAETVFNTIAVYPNPAKGEVHIDNVALEKAAVYDALGKLVKTTTFTDGSTKNTINLAGLTSGIYYIYLQSGESTIVKKIIVE